MGPQGLYVNKRMRYFDPAVDVTTVVPVWVRLLNLLVHCWNWDSLKHIGNALGKFIDWGNNKDQYDYARICIEVDLEVGHLEAIKINVGSWTHVRKLDYEQLPFKCQKCHVYGHFSRGCPSNGEVEKGRRRVGTRSSRQRPPINPTNSVSQMVKALNQLLFFKPLPRMVKKKNLGP